MAGEVRHRAGGIRALSALPQ